MALIQRIAALAQQTFTHINNVDRKVFKDNLTKLVATSNKLTKLDVGLLPEYLIQKSFWTANSREPPVTYIDVFKNDFFTVGIFIVKHGANIPLHDHPGMYGIIKVLHGKLKIQSYTKAEFENKRHLTFGTPISVQKNSSVMVGENDAPGVLTPNDMNLHEIKAEGGIAAFLDVLAPPYDSAHDCHYYEEMETSRENASTIHLVEIDPPDTYWTDTRPYVGPPVHPESV